MKIMSLNLSNVQLIDVSIIMENLHFGTWGKCSKEGNVAPVQDCNIHHEKPINEYRYAKPDQRVYKTDRRSRIPNLEEPDVLLKAEIKIFIVNIQCNLPKIKIIKYIHQIHLNIFTHNLL